jgi:Tol biopolymer transport system component
MTHRFPAFLPDGNRFLFVASREQDQFDIATSSLSSPGSVRIANSGVRPSFAVAGAPYLLSSRGQRIMAQRFDDSLSRAEGDPVVLAEDADNYSVSDNGVLAYRAHPPPRTRLTRVDGLGNRSDALELQGLNDISMSPDGTQAAAVLEVASSNDLLTGRNDLWMIDMARGTRTRLTFFEGQYRQAAPLWSPGGSRLVFSSNHKGVFNLYERSVNGQGSDVALLPPRVSRFATSWSRDGRYLVFHEHDRNFGFDIWFLPMGGDRKPVPFLRTEYNERQGQLSPDGKWLVYTSNESGRREIYVQAFRVAWPDGPEGKWTVSTAGGHSPKWSSDGKRLFYIGEDRKLVSVGVTHAGGFRVTLPKPQFALSGYAATANFVYRYDVCADGRFLVVDQPESGPQPIVILVNWPAILGK